MEVFRIRIETGGKIQIPPKVLEELELEVGQDVELEVENKSLRVSSSPFRQRKEAQEFIRQRIKKSGSVVDEFIEERRLEALND